MQLLLDPVGGDVVEILAVLLPFGTILLSMHVAKKSVMYSGTKIMKIEANYSFSVCV